MNKLQRKILNVLQDGNEHPGIAICKRINSDTPKAFFSWFCHVSMARLYPALYRLEKQGLILSRWAESTEDRGWSRRRVYWLSELGLEDRRKRFQEGLEAIASRTINDPQRVTNMGANPPRRSSRGS